MDKQSQLRTYSRSFHNLLNISSLLPLITLFNLSLHSSNSLLLSILHSLCHALLASLSLVSLRKRLYLFSSMASETEVSEISSLFERMMRNRDLSLFLPFFFGFSNTSSRRDGEDPDQETESTETSQRERIILINPFTQGMVVVDDTSGLEALFRELGSKGGQPPASKESIDDMPSIEIGEGEDGECVICLEEWEVGGVAREMPCKHKFHPNCIEKWLGIHGSCPVCRYQMPVDEKDVGKKRDEEGGERRRGDREVWVSFSFNTSRRSEDSNQAPSADSTVSPLSLRGDSEVES